MSVAVADPYYLYESILDDLDGIKILTKYLAEFLVGNKNTDHHLLAYRMG